MTFNTSITIAIPVYERYDFFEEALNSAIKQSIHCSVIVVDNCSSHTKFSDYVESLGLHNISYFRNEVNLGAVGNWNRCIELTATKWVSILHSDDMLASNYIEVMGQVIAHNSEEAAIICADEVGELPLKIFDPSSKIVYGKKLKPAVFLFGNHAGFPGNVFNKERLGQGRFKDLKGASDYAFWYELSLKRPLITIKNILAFYRQSSEQDSATMDINEVVLTPTYLYRRNFIKFKNPLLKLLSMYELFRLYRYYQHSYKRKEESHFKFSNAEIEKYFHFFNDRLTKIFLFPLLRVAIYVSKIIL